MSDLKAKMERAKRSETFKGKDNPESKVPAKKAAKRASENRTPKPKGESQVEAVSAEDTMTANERARAAAGIAPKPSRTAAQRQADRRRSFAQLAVEISTDRKAELLAAAADNGRTLKDEVIYRLFGDE